MVAAPSAGGRRRMRRVTVAGDLDRQANDGGLALTAPVTAARGCSGRTHENPPEVPAEGRGGSIPACRSSPPATS